MKPIKSIKKVKAFLRELANPVNRWEWEDGESMAPDIKAFLDYIDALEGKSK